MTNISIPRQDTIFGPLTSPAIIWPRLRRWLAGLQEKLDQRLLADGLEQLRQRDPALYADLHLDSNEPPPQRSVLPLLPPAVVAGFLLEEKR